MRFTTANLKISGPINYKTEVMTFCCGEMKDTISRADWIFDGKGVKIFGEQEYFKSCPCCKARLKRET